MKEDAATEPSSRHGTKYVVVDARLVTSTALKGTEVG